MKNRKSFVLLMTALTMLFLSASVQAGLTFYTDRTAWENAVAGTIITETFDTVEPYYMTDGINHAGLIDIELIELSSVSEWNSINDGTGILNINGTPYYQGGSSGSGARSINLIYPSTAFAGDFVSTHSGGGLTLNVNGADYEFTSLIPSGLGTGFMGFVSTTGFSQVTLYDAAKNETFGLDNVSYVIPSPGAAMLGLIGLITVGRVKRKSA